MWKKLFFSCDMTFDFIHSHKSS